MREVLKCSVNEDFFVTAKFDENDSDGGLKRIDIKLFCSEDDEKVLATKSFLWPETKFPSELTYDNEKSILVFRGSLNEAQIPFNLVASINARQYLTSSSRTVIYSSSSLKKVEAYPEAVSIILNIIEQKDIEDNWKKLLGFCQDGNLPSLLPGLFLSSFEQEKFWTFVMERIESEENLKLLSFLIKKGIFTSPKLETKIIKFCADKKYVEPILTILDTVNMIQEEAYAYCLKLIVQSSESNGEKLLKSLLLKSFSNSALCSHVFKYLSDDDVIVLIDHLTLALKLNQKVYSFNKIINLLNTLIDSHAERLIWNEKSKNSLAGITELITDMMQSLDVFSSFDVKITEKQKLGDKICAEPRLSDYSIQQVSFKVKYI